MSAREVYFSCFLEKLRMIKCKVNFSSFFYWGFLLLTILGVECFVEVSVSQS